MKKTKPKKKVSKTAKPKKGTKAKKISKTALKKLAGGIASAVIPRHCASSNPRNYNFAPSFLTYSSFPKPSPRPSGPSGSGRNRARSGFGKSI